MSTKLVSLWKLFDIKEIWRPHNLSFHWLAWLIKKKISKLQVWTKMKQFQSSTVSWRKNIIELCVCVIFKYSCIALSFSTLHTICDNSFIFVKFNLEERKKIPSIYCKMCGKCFKTKCDPRNIYKKKRLETPSWI